MALRAMYYVSKYKYKYHYAYVGTHGRPLGRRPHSPGRGAGTVRGRATKAADDLWRAGVCGLCGVSTCTNTCPHAVQVHTAYVHVPMYGVPSNLWWRRGKPHAAGLHGQPVRQQPAPPGARARHPINHIVHYMYLNSVPTLGRYVPLYYM